MWKIANFFEFSLFRDNRLFIVCLNFIGKPKSLSKFIVNKGFLVNIFPDLTLPKDFVNTMRQVNTDIANRQLIDVNKIIDFIDKNNYYGNLYQHYRNDQIKASKYWINKYLPKKSDFDKSKKETEQYIEDIIEQNKHKVTTLANRLTY